MVVWADSGRVIQILNNLLGNAAKFTHQGHIRMSASWHDPLRQWVAVQVTDTGIGIPKHKLSSIFLPFEQVDGSISRQYGGFGLGLSITQELVKAHGGELWVRSKENKGSSFTFTLPAFTGQSRPAERVAGSSNSLAALALGVPTGAGSGSSMPLMPLRTMSATLAAAASDTAGHTKQGTVSDVSDVRVLDRVLSASSFGVSADLLDNAVTEEFAKELPYNAAQLSALASNKPFKTPAGSSSPNSRAKKAGSRDAAAQKVQRDSRPTQFARTGRHQVLSVDDDPVNQTVVQSVLSSTGYEVVCLSNGQQALDHIERCEVLPDLILMDVQMPDILGPEVCRQLALRVPVLSVPVIMVSAHKEESTVVQGLDSGADDYIIKPFRRAEFLARIRAKLQLSNAVTAGSSDTMDNKAAGGPLAPGDDHPLVLCVDDDEVNHLVLDGMLQSQSYRYLKARSGAEALQLIATNHPHLVLLEAALPDNTGLDILQQIRTSQPQSCLPIIMLAARHNEKAIVKALDAGANDYVLKPFSRVPLLVAELTGLEGATADLTPESHSHLLGYIADCFDALAEKYAVLKLEATDSSLTVAAPLPLISVAAEPSATAAAAAAYASGASTHVSAMAAANGGPAAADRPLSLGKGALQLRIAVHVGSLYASVVGARRPRYRLLGPALHTVKQAAAAAPPNSVVITGAAALQLLVAGIGGLQALAASAGADGPEHEGSTGQQEEEQLWLYRAAGVPDGRGGAGVAGTTADGDHVLVPPVKLQARGENLKKPQGSRGSRVAAALTALEAHLKAVKSHHHSAMDIKPAAPDHRRAVCAVLVVAG
eukprot:gene13645-13768_t